MSFVLYQWRYLPLMSLFPPLVAWIFCRWFRSFLSVTKKMLGKSSMSIGCCDVCYKQLLGNLCYECQFFSSVHNVCYEKCGLTVACPFEVVSSVTNNYWAHNVCNEKISFVTSIHFFYLARTPRLIRWPSKTSDFENWRTDA